MEDDLADIAEEIFTEGAVRLKQAPHVSEINTYTRLVRTDTTHTAYSMLLDVGKLVYTFAEFCTKVRLSRSLGKARVVSIECYRQSAGPVTHRFLLLHLRRYKRNDIWLRIDRQLAPNLTLPKFFARYFQSAANDSVCYLTHHGVIHID